VGHYLSSVLALPLLDKDDYLESLFNTQGFSDTDRRHNLSRQADVLFQREAESKNDVILVSHWRPRHGQADYGTPSQWLADSYYSIIEIYCMCPVAVAASRFVSRVRHKGHVDKSRTPAVVAQWLQDYSVHLPIGLGKCMPINTESQSWKDELDILLEEYL